MKDFSFACLYCGWAYLLVKTIQPDVGLPMLILGEAIIFICHFTSHATPSKGI